MRDVKKSRGHLPPMTCRLRRPFAICQRDPVISAARSSNSPRCRILRRRSSRSPNGACGLRRALVICRARPFTNLPRPSAASPRAMAICRACLPTDHAHQSFAARGSRVQTASLHLPRASATCSRRSSSAPRLSVPAPPCTAFPRRATICAHAAVAFSISGEHVLNSAYRNLRRRSITSRRMFGIPPCESAVFQEHSLFCQARSSSRHAVQNSTALPRFPRDFVYPHCCCVVSRRRKREPALH